MKNKWLILLMVSALLFLASAYGLYLFNQKVPTLENTRPDFQISANELFDSFDENEDAATIKYTNKILEITGEVAAIKNNQSNIILAAENALAGGINCSMKEPVSGIVKGQNITVKGRCQGFLMDVVLNNCHVVK